MSAIQARVDALRTLAFGSITTSYVAVGTPITHRLRIIHFVNSTNVDLLISFDGTTDNLFIGAGSFILYDMQANATTNATFAISQLTQIYAKRNAGAPASGAIYVMGVYGKGE